MILTVSRHNPDASTRSEDLTPSQAGAVIHSIKEDLIARCGSYSHRQIKRERGVRHVFRAGEEAVVVDIDADPD